MAVDDNLTRVEARRRAALLSDVAYEVELDLSGGGDLFRSLSRVTFACEEPGASSFIDIIAHSVDTVTLNGREVDAFDGGRIRLDDLADRNELVVDAACAYQRTGVGLHRFADPVDDSVYVHTQFEPFDAHRVYACFDQPDMKAPFTLAVHAPPGWEVVSNERVTERPDAVTGGLWRFDRTLPLPTYITAVVAGPFVSVHERHGDVDLGLYCRQSLAEHFDPDEIFEVTRQGFDFYTQAFDYPYPFGKYDQLFVPEFNWGAMENAGCVTFSESYVFRSKVTQAARMGRASTILHELAHMWFGNLVTMRWWDDLWLNESFATYIGTLALAEATRFGQAWTRFATGPKAWAVAQDQLPTTHPIVADIVDTEATRTHFDGITYAKGASVLKQLVAWVGRDAFIAGLRGYFRRHEFGNAELADFLQALEAPSGRNLGAWSAQWLETSGVATLRADTGLDADGRYVSFAVEQDVTDDYPTLRDHRLAIGLYDDGEEGLRRRRRVELDVGGARTDVAELAEAFRPDLLLVNDDDLTFAKLRLDEYSIETLTRSLGRLDEPLARALSWGATWDMTRDAQLPARRFVRLVADHATAEREVGLLQSLLGRALIAIDRYGDPGNRAAMRSTLSARARGTLAAAEPGGDLQLVWASCAIGTVEDDDEVTWARGLLDGTVEVPGLAVDTDLRWQLVAALAAGGHVRGDVIDAEGRRDATDMGARRAAAARAARPDADAKSSAWQVVLEEPDHPLAMRRAVAGSFWQFGQDRLLEPYVGRYIDALQAIWTDRNPEESILLTEALYPSTIVDEQVVDAVERALEDSALPAPARRTLLEQQDATKRALRARAIDRG